MGTGDYYFGDGWYRTLLNDYITPGIIAEVEDKAKSPIWDAFKKQKSNLPEDVMELTLYRVFMIYGEDRKNLITLQAEVVAHDEEDAKIKSGLLTKVSTEWDADYLTFIVETIGTVKVKKKPQEVKNV